MVKRTIKETWPLGELNEQSPFDQPNLVFEQGEFTGPKVFATLSGSLEFTNYRGFSNTNVVWTYRYDQFLSGTSSSTYSLVDSTTANAKWFCLAGRAGECHCHHDSGKSGMVVFVCSGTHSELFS